MFGLYRTCLALAVVATHLLKVPVIGGYAVQAFFILSGFLMTTIMNRNYGYSLKGVASFAVNRFLRLYPSYWVIVLLSVGVIMFWGEGSVRAYHSAIYLPASPTEWLQNLSLVYTNTIPMYVSPRLAPPTWALTVELLFYMLIALGLSRGKKLTCLWFFVSILYIIYVYISGLDPSYRYLHVLSGSLPFSIGAMAYHYGDQIKNVSQRYSTQGWLLAFSMIFLMNSVLAALAIHVWSAPVVVLLCFYANICINFGIIAILINRPKLPISAAFDKKIGDYSYPLYLCHWQAGFVASMLLFGRPERGPSLYGGFAFLLALIISGMVSYVTIRYVDHPIERLRSKIRAKSKVG